MIIQQVKCANYNLYITGVSPKDETHGTIVYRIHKDGNIQKFVEEYEPDTGHKDCILTITRFIPLVYLYRFIALNQGLDLDNEFELKETLIDSLEPDKPIKPLGGNFG